MATYCIKHGRHEHERDYCDDCYREGYARIHGNGIIKENP